MQSQARAFGAPIFAGLALHNCLFKYLVNELCDAVTQVNTRNHRRRVPPFTLPRLCAQSVQRPLLFAYLPSTSVCVLFLL